MRLPDRPLLVALGVAVTAILAVDLLVDRLSAHSVPRQVMQRIASAPDTIDILAVGNSLIAAGFDPAVVQRIFEQAGRRATVINGGLGSSGPIEQLALTRLALGHHAVGTIVYGFFDQQMFNDGRVQNADLTGNHSMLYYQEPALTRQYARFDVLNRLLFEVHRSSALLRERGTIWARIERLRRRAGSAGMPPEATNQFGRRADFDLLESRDSEAFALACQRALQSGAMLGPPIEALIGQSRAHGAKVVIVEMPVHPLHQRRFYEQPIWATFRERTRTAVEREGGVYLNASTWLPDADMFDDHLHLSREGASRFSERLAHGLLVGQNR